MEVHRSLHREPKTLTEESGTRSTDESPRASRSVLLGFGKEASQFATEKLNHLRGAAKKNPFNVLLETSSRHLPVGIATVEKENVHPALARILHSVGDMIKEGYRDPDMPDFLLRHLDEAHEKYWREACRFIHDALSEHMPTAEEDEALRLQLNFRAPTPDWRKRPFSWFRAKVLYTLMPYDGSIFTTLRDPYRSQASAQGPMARCHRRRRCCCCPAAT